MIEHARQKFEQKLVGRLTTIARHPDPEKQFTSQARLLESLKAALSSEDLLEAKELAAYSGSLDCSEADFAECWNLIVSQKDSERIAAGLEIVGQATHSNHFLLHASEFRDLLNHPEPEVRREMLKAIGRTRSLNVKAIAQDLQSQTIQCLLDSDAGVRRWAVLVLWGAAHNQEVQEAIKDLATREENFEVRHEAQRLARSGQLGKGGLLSIANFSIPEKASRNGVKAVLTSIANAVGSVKRDSTSVVLSTSYADVIIAANEDALDFEVLTPPDDPLVLVVDLGAEGACRVTSGTSQTEVPIYKIQKNSHGDKGAHVELFVGRDDDSQR